MKKPHGFDDLVNATTPFAIRTFGSCMMPHIEDGSRVTVDPAAPWPVGSLVLVAFRPGVVRTGGVWLQVKRLYSRPGLDLSRLPYRVKATDFIPPILRLQQFNPPMIHEVDARDLAAVFPIVKVERMAGEPERDKGVTVREYTPEQYAAAYGGR